MYQELEIYIHIPFCVKKCAYCDFLSFALTQKDKNPNEYIDALIKEIEANDRVAKNYRVKTIFIGGGTPSLLEANQIEKIFQALHRIFQIDVNAEVTIEANPGTITKDKLLRFRGVGINRFSIGLQSTVDAELICLGRIHTYEQFLESFALAREVGFQNINVDIMSALPGQSLASYEETLLKITTLNPEHISAYSLILEEGTPFFEQYADDLEQLPKEEEERLMYLRTRQILEQNGYYRYEISNYAKPGFACEHNIGYWKRKNYLGFGVGAASLIQNERFKNTSDYSEYLRNSHDLECIRIEREKLPIRAQMEEFMFLGLRMCDGISKTEFFAAFSLDYESVYGQVTRKLSGQGLLAETHDTVKLTEEGISVSNYVLSEFLLGS